MVNNKKAKDLVCGMEITVNSSTLSTNYQGTDYYFCSAHCSEKFAKDPQNYVTDSHDCCGKGEHSKHLGHDHGEHHHHCKNGHDHQHSCKNHHNHQHHHQE